MIKALSIRQPWAWLIVNGYKPVENRKWKTAYRGDLIIHAAKKLDEKGYMEVCNRFPEVELPSRFDLERGGIVGGCRLIDCVTEYPSPWFSGPYGLILADAIPLPFRPVRGKLGLFTAVTCE